MKIKEVQTALLSNHEVLLHLQELDAEYTGTDGTGRARKKPKGVSDILQDGQIYLTNPDAPIANVAETHPNRPMTLYKGPHSLFRALSPKYRLNRQEFLQIYNIRPRTGIALDLIIEESESRFTETERLDILNIITSVFDEEESGIPAGVEDQEMEKVANKLLGAKKRGRKGKRKGKKEDTGP
ncbi:hypothetical protein P154DRAFT_516860 [Amniculicola lignicola CBS 123094]|uniref:DNA-directed RNA polymerase III subunit RPC9 n=1 Tax=Amniculicola lignicola CBS 123094 TaxID=1392246 RepID=A0A6A5X5D9_9PLEO|nr:hypothetical protein P154DRAFT_516860 [Amniculicola lignicola CBS 123094]